MSNFKKANDLARKWIDSVGGLSNINHIYGDDVSVLIYTLRDAGLLAPDLPEPEVRHLEEVDTDVLAWKSDHIEVGVYKNWIAMGDPLESGMTVDESRRLALALLAACEYAEKEQDSEC